MFRTTSKILILYSWHIPQLTPEDQSLGKKKLNDSGTQTKLGC